jgi:prepilin-type N-terminal cleavage/methylation domain-containing protein
MTFSARSDRGFSVVELLLVVAVIATVTVIAVPALKDLSENLKLSQATRMVERELQSARLKSVSTNRSLRVWPNCPAAGYMRTVEVLGTAADSDGNRCSQSAYPYPAPDVDVITRPNFDGPVRLIPNDASVTNAVIEFRPDGTAMKVVGGVATGFATDEVVTITISRHSSSRTVTVNGAGKVLLVR